MNPVEFQSSSATIVVSWIVFFFWLAAVVRALEFLFKKKDDMPHLATIWTGLCILILSPVRYAFFQILLFNVYCFQSITTLLSLVFVNIILYVIIRLLIVVCISFPYLINNFLFVDREKVTFGRGLIAVVVVPVACVLSSSLYYFLLPYTGWTLQWLNYRDLVRATNGSPAFVFKYVSKTFSYVILPEFFLQTPKTDRDELRCHVASLYMSKSDEFRFFKTQYPDLYIKLNPALAVHTFELSPTNLQGGDASTATVSLEKPSTIDVPVSVSSSNAAVASVPATVTIPKGQLLATFQVTTAKPLSATSVTLSATTGGLAKVVVLKVNP